MPERSRPRAAATGSAVASPCIRNCCLDEHDICLGCFRSLNEITAWGGSTETERRAILRRAQQRRQQASR